MLSETAASTPGRLRHRLTLERATATPDGAGGSTLSWDDVATLFADVMPLRAEEREAGEGLSDLTLQRVVIRKRDDVAAGDRFRLGARLLRIKTIVDADEDGRYLVCTCEEEGT